MIRGAKRTGTFLLLFALLSAPPTLQAGAQRYEPLADAVRAALATATQADAPPPIATLAATFPESAQWVAKQQSRVARYLPDPIERDELLYTVWYEAARAGLPPDLVLAVIHVESRFRKYAVSTAGAHGYMQVMPFWVDLIGTPEHNLFHLRTNLRYGTVILRHYLDIEQGDLVRALGRYNGSLGDPTYPNLVFAALNHYR
ncbi:transglycosylase SLT domain-containing protein [Hydrogenophilus thermoluteolus]|jgi:soluble lytic murein transglycosylase-like protein|nr:transglycosylase SLT domain-containing protein [Hydrogenophilus thermoluteolus]MBW7657405.1 transglycosylase SLT domain-containing protein [Hydrogenophilus thermoluteolus]